MCLKLGETLCIQGKLSMRTHFGGEKTLLAIVLSGAVLLASLQAQAPSLLNYQGRIAVEGVNFDSLVAGRLGQFKFALVDGSNPPVVYWSNDGSINGQTTLNAPTNSVALPVSKGLYSVFFGETTLPNMTAVPASVFTTHPDVRVRVWFDDGVKGFELLSPDRRIGSVGYAITAGSATTALSVADGSITSAKLAPNIAINGTIPTSLGLSILGAADAAAARTALGLGVMATGNGTVTLSGTQPGTIFTENVGGHSASVSLVANPADSAHRFLMLGNNLQAQTTPGFAFGPIEQSGMGWGIGLENNYTNAQGFSNHEFYLMDGGSNRPLWVNWSQTEQGEMALASGVVSCAEPHNLAAGKQFQFASLLGASGVTAGTDYFVLAAGLTSTTFTFSATRGGAPNSGTASGGVWTRGGYGAGGFGVPTYVQVGDYTNAKWGAVTFGVTNTKPGFPALMVIDNQGATSGKRSMLQMGPGLQLTYDPNSTNTDDFILSSETGGTLWKDQDGHIGLGMGQSDGYTLHAKVTVGGVLAVTAGTAAAPTYTFHADPDTGFYSLAPNEIGVALSGIKQAAFRNENFEVYRSEKTLRLDPVLTGAGTRAGLSTDQLTLEFTAGDKTGADPKLKVSPTGVTIGTGTEITSSGATGAALVASGTASAARALLGLGSLATQNSESITATSNLPTLNLLSTGGGAAAAIQLRTDSLDPKRTTTFLGNNLALNATGAIQRPDATRDGAGLQVETNWTTAGHTANTYRFLDQYGRAPFSLEWRPSESLGSLALTVPLVIDLEEITGNSEPAFGINASVASPGLATIYVRNTDPDGNQGAQLILGDKDENNGWSLVNDFSGDGTGELVIRQRNSNRFPLMINPNGQIGIGHAWGESWTDPLDVKGALRVGLLKLIPQGPPINPAEGWIYADSATHRLYFHNGTEWIQPYTNPTGVLSALTGIDGLGSGLDTDLVRGTPPSALGLALLGSADPSVARAAQGLGSLATQDTDAVEITGGTITSLARLEIATGPLVADRPTLLTSTWNADAVAFTALKINVTDLASGAGSLLQDWQIGGASRLALRKDGTLLGPAGSTEIGFDLGGYGRLSHGGTAIASWNSTAGWMLGTQIALSWNNDLRLERDGPASLQLGNDQATPVAQTLKAHDGLGADKAGADLTLAAGQGTGTARGGSIRTATSNDTATGPTLGTLSTRTFQSAQATALTEAVATPLAKISLAAGRYLGGRLFITIEAGDGTDIQVHSAILVFSAVNKEGVIVANFSPENSPTDAVTAGTLTANWSIAQDGPAVVIQTNTNSSLEQTRLTCKWSLEINSNDPAIVTPF